MKDEMTIVLHLYESTLELTVLILIPMVTLATVERKMIESRHIHIIGTTQKFDEFKKQLSKTVVYEVHTPYYYTNSAGRIKLDRCCGVSVSDPSTHSFASAKTATSWWIDTH